MQSGDRVYGGDARSGHGYEMGTCYLTTNEIVQTGALTELYQRMIVESGPGATVMTGEGTGLRVRSLKTQRIEEICSLEREFASGTEEESVFRKRIEALTAGSLLIAARGLAEPNGTPLDQQACVEEGQFMSGASAGILDQCVFWTSFTVSWLREASRMVSRYWVRFG